MLFPFFKWGNKYDCCCAACRNVSERQEPVRFCLRTGDVRKDRGHDPDLRRQMFVHLNAWDGAETLLHVQHSCQTTAVITMKSGAAWTEERETNQIHSKQCRSDNFFGFNLMLNEVISSFPALSLVSVFPRVLVGRCTNCCHWNEHLSKYPFICCNKHLSQFNWSVSLFV